MDTRNTLQSESEAEDNGNEGREEQQTAGTREMKNQQT